MHRSSSQPATFLFIFHHLSHLPIDSELLPVANVGEVDVDVFIERMVEVRDELKDKASSNITKAQQSRKEYYDSRHSSEVYDLYT